MKRTLVFSLLIIFALGAGYWVAQRVQAHPQARVLASARQSYVCPMHAHIVQDHPGTCPICGMDLVLANTAHTDESNQIEVDSATQQRLGVRLASVEKADLAATTHTYGTLVLDDSAVYRVTPTIDGVLVKLHAARPGQRIAAGGVLYELYSEELLQHQNEYLDFLKRLAVHRKNEERLRAQNQKERELAKTQDAAIGQQTELDIKQREEQSAIMLQPIQRDGQRLSARLKYVGFTEDMLRSLEQRRQALSVVPIRAQRACVVKDVSARAGMAVNAMTEIISCVNNAQAWLEIALYPDQVQASHAGDTFTARFDNGSVAQGRINDLSPTLDASTRTLRARVPIQLQDKMPVGSYADVTIAAAPRELLSIPKEAVLHTGKGDMVMRALSKGHFQPVNIVTGIETDKRVAVLKGLQAGDQVALNGQFLLDAAASIADTAQRLETPMARAQP